MTTLLSLKNLLRVASSMALLALICTPVHGQWTKLPASAIPTGPRWKTDSRRAGSSIVRRPPSNGGYNQNLAKDLKPADVPYQPWAKALADERATGLHEREDPDANYLPQGVPRINGVPPPWKIVQTPGFVVIVYEAFNLWRQIFLDGRELGEDFTPTWMGYSTGKWEGDTLVVDTKGFNGKTWLDQA
ncbi:MAG: hypothetical protein DMG19_06415, partial [Acidobacteria bacterium]